MPSICEQSLTNRQMREGEVLSTSYRTPIGAVRYEQIIKKSRFIAISTHVPDQARRKIFLAEVAAEFPDARHVCHASIIGAPATGQQFFNDDGEPSGTAGKPILNVLQHSELGDITTAVVRYFGGIKLGAGGLVRAYSSSASGTMSAMTTRIVEQTVAIHLQVDFALENDIRHLLGEFGISKLDVSYENKLHVKCNAPVNLTDALRIKLVSAARGNIVIRIDESD